MREEKNIVLSDSTAPRQKSCLNTTAKMRCAPSVYCLHKLLFFSPRVWEDAGSRDHRQQFVAAAGSGAAGFLDFFLFGETAANLRKVFDYFSQYPVVALFDEFDALTKDRGDSADHGELKRSVNAVLQMMDGYRGNSILIATTNYESLLDKAVWRRFDEIIKFDMPNLEQIKRLLAMKLGGVRRGFEPADTLIASMFKGMSHADIERVLRRAVKEMILSGREFLEKPHLDAALAREHRVQA